MTRARLTADEKAERAAAQRERHNAKRKKDYHSNPERRDAILDQSRRSYQAVNNVETFDCRANLSKLDDFGDIRNVLDDYAGSKEARTYTTRELADVIGQYIDVLYRWQRKDLIPRAVVRAEVFAGDSMRPTVQFVYLREEVEAMLHPLGDHKSRYAQLRESHIETVGAIHGAVQAVRNRLKIAPVTH